MIKHHKIDADEFLEFVHDVDLNFLKEDLFLRDEIKRLKGKKNHFHKWLEPMRKMLRKE